MGERRRRTWIACGVVAAPLVALACNGVLVVPLDGGADDGGVVIPGVDATTADVASSDASIDHASPDTSFPATDAPSTNDAPDVCTGTMCGSTCVDLSSNADNCGTCGHACPTGCTGGYCALELVVPAAQPGELVESVAVDATHVYWSDSRLFSAQYDGGGVQEIATYATGIFATDPTHVYFQDNTDLRVFDPSDPDAGTPIVVAGSGVFAIDDAYFYVVATSPSYALERIPRAGGSPEVLASIPAGRSWFGGGANVVYVAAASQSDAGDYTTEVYVLAKDGGTAFVPLASIPGEARGIAEGPGYVVIGGQFGASVTAITIDGGAITPLATETYVESIVTDGDWVYFVDEQLGVVGKVLRDGGSPTVLENFGSFDAGGAQYVPSAMTQDGANLYFAISYREAGVYRLPK